VKISLLRSGNAKAITLPKRKARIGWAKASQWLARNGDHALVWPEFPNAEDKTNSW
jgi:hypothetical protein